jgi:hypothetical protein
VFYVHDLSIGGTSCTCDHHFLLDQALFEYQGDSCMDRQNSNKDNINVNFTLNTMTWISTWGVKRSIGNYEKNMHRSLRD